MGLRRPLSPRMLGWYLQPVEVEDLSKHCMDSEFFIIPDRTADMVNDAKKARRKILAVGTL